MILQSMSILLAGKSRIYMTRIICKDLRSYSMQALSPTSHKVRLTIKSALNLLPN